MTSRIDDEITHLKTRVRLSIEGNVNDQAFEENFIIELNRLIQLAFERMPDCHNALSYCFSDLISLVNSYYQQVYYQPKNNWKKFLSYFGLGQSPREKNILHSLKLLTQYKNEQNKLFEKSWAVPGILKFIAGVVGEFSNIRILNKLIQFVNYLLPDSKLKSIFHRLATSIRNANLEGMSVGISANATKKDLEKFMESYGELLSPDFENQISSAINHLGMFYQIDELVLSSKLCFQFNKNETLLEYRLNHIAFAVEDKLLKLKPGEKIVLPFGFRSRAGGHGAVIEFSRKLDLSFDMTYFNTGSGAEAGKRILQLMKMWWRWSTSASIFSNITVADIKNSDLIKNLIKPSHATYATSEEGLLAMQMPLDVLAQSHPVREGVNYPLQTLCTCAHDSLIAWLRSHLDEGLFRHFRTFVVERALGKLNKFLSRGPSSYPSLVSKMSSVEVADVIPKLRREGEEKLQTLKKDANDYMRSLENKGVLVKNNQVFFTTKKSRKEIPAPEYANKIRAKLVKYHLRFINDYGHEPSVGLTDFFNSTKHIAFRKYENNKKKSEGLAEKQKVGDRLKVLSSLSRLA